jgi:acylphosphatase
VPEILVEVVGRVQGVGFRWFIRERARALQVAGWVRNLDSGGVEVAAKGSDEALATLLAAVREGPPGARVSRVIERSRTPVGEFPSPFTVMR